MLAAPAFPGTAADGDVEMVAIIRRGPLAPDPAKRRQQQRRGDLRRTRCGQHGSRAICSRRDRSGARLGSPSAAGVPILAQLPAATA